MSTRRFVAIVFVVLAATSVKADEVDTLIQEGQKAYDAKNYQKTVEIFQQVVTQVQAKMGTMIAKFFPEAEKGWSAGEIENSNWSGSSGGESHSFVNSSRTYTRTSDSMEISMQFCNWPTIVQGAKAGMQAYSNPMMAQIFKQQGIEFKSEEKNGWQVVSIVNTQDDETQIMAFSDQMMIQVQTQASAGDSAFSYFAKIDLKGLNDALK